MLKIIHRINTVEELRKIPKKYGVEVDIRTRDDQLILHHEPFHDGDLLEDYLNEFAHSFIILEIKEEGIEKRVLGLCQKYGIKDYFLLSVTYPFMYLLTREGEKKMAVRFSEFEDINTALSMQGKVDWVWVDTFTELPLIKQNYGLLKKAGFKICLVCPERWGRSQDISRYKQTLEAEDIKLDAVMTSIEYVERWNN